MWHLWNIRNHVHAVKIVLNMSDTDAHACFIIIIQHNISVTFMVPHGSIFDNCSTTAQRMHHFAVLLDKLHESLDNLIVYIIICFKLLLKWTLVLACHQLCICRFVTVVKSLKSYFHVYSLPLSLRFCV